VAGIRERVIKAIGLMEYRDMGIHSASKLAGTTAGTVTKYLRNEGLRLKKFKGRYVVVKPLRERVEDAMCEMNRGVPAYMSAKKSGTTLETLKKTTYKGRPVLRKVKGQWKSNYICIYDWSVVFFGRLVNMDGNNMGNPQALKDPPDAKYATVLWQYDCDHFRTPLDPVQLCDFHPPRVLDVLRAKMVNTVRANPTVATEVLGRPSQGQKVAAQATLDLGMKKIPPVPTLATLMQLSSIDVYFRSYRLDFDDAVECGVDDNLPQRRPKFVAVSTFKTAKKLVMKTKGNFEIIVRRGNESYHYPPSPASIQYNHNWKEEATYAKLGG